MYTSISESCLNIQRSRMYREGVGIRTLEGLNLYSRVPCEVLDPTGSASLPQIDPRFVNSIVHTIEVHVHCSSEFEYNTLVREE